MEINGSTRIYFTRHINNEIKPSSIIPTAGIGRNRVDPCWNRPVPLCSGLFLATGFRPVFAGKIPATFRSARTGTDRNSSGEKPAGIRLQGTWWNKTEPAGSDRVRITWVILTIDGGYFNILFECTSEYKSTNTTILELSYNKSNARLWTRSALSRRKNIFGLSANYLCRVRMLFIVHSLIPKGTAANSG